LLQPFHDGPGKPVLHFLILLTVIAGISKLRSSRPALEATAKLLLQALVAEVCFTLAGKERM